MFQSTPEVLPLFNAPFLARLTSVQAGSGDFADLWLYGFQETIPDPTTGVPLDAVPGRSDNLSGAATSFAVEVNNQELTVPGSTPSGYTNAGPYVWMRLRCTVAGSPIYEFDIGTMIGGVNLQTGTSYTFVQSDYGKLVSFSNASAISAGLPQAGSSGGNFGAYWFVDVENRGAGSLQVAPTTSTIDGAANITLSQNQGVRIFSDGTNYYTQRGMATGGIDLYNYPSTLVTAGATALYGDANGVITFGGGGETILVATATASQDGVVVTTQQTFAGQKQFTGTNCYFDNGLIVGNSITVGTGIQSGFSLTLPSMSMTASTVVYTDATGAYTAELDFAASSTEATITAPVDAFITQNDLMQAPVFGGATGDTTGFLYIASCAGAPTGVPSRAAVGTGNYAAMRYDRTNHKLYIYDPGSSSWKSVLLS